MSTWDAARLASRRPLPKPRKMMGPVGDELLDNRRTTPMLDIHDYMSCHGCGHHVCSCAHLLHDRIAPTSGRLISASPMDTRGGCRSDAPTAGALTGVSATSHALWKPIEPKLFDDSARDNWLLLA